jgi:uncharacterized protein YdbL (DUF1318 family)
MKTGIATICTLILCASCASVENRARPALDENVARMIAVVVEDIVDGVQDIDSLSDVAAGGTVATQDVRDAVETRRVRHKSVAYYKTLECVGENRRGFIERLDCEACQTKKQLDLVAVVVITENDDRRVVYKGITKANRLPSTSRDTLQSAFRAEHERRAAAGEWYETDEGQWLPKHEETPK